MQLPFSLALALLVAPFGCVLGVLWLRLARARRAMLRCQRGHRAAVEAREGLVRRLRLGAHDVREAGMSVHGHADQLAAGGHDGAAGLAVAAADLLDLADDLQDLTFDAAAPRVVRDEEIALGELVDEAIGRVAAMILPGRRHFRIQPDLRPVLLRADRRALRHVLGRVLADAVRNTRQDDWIDISARRSGEEFVLAVADEGRGMLAPEATPARRDSRGIGLRLSLARALMEAYGGRVVVEARPAVGCQVSLVLPAARVAGFSPRSRSCAAPAPAGGSAGR